MLTVAIKRNILHSLTSFIFFLILNSAKGIFFITGMFSSLSQKNKIYFVQWTADIINKINMKEEKNPTLSVK